MPRIELKRKPKPPHDTVAEYFAAKVKRDLFAQEFCKDLNATQAMVRIGFKGLNPSNAACEVLRIPYVQDKIAKILSARADRLQIAGDDIARHWFAIATADARELCPVVVACCRHCWGVDNQYQYTINEMRRARTKHFIAQKAKKEEYRVPFDEQGGDGYNFRLAPNADCPECNGIGVNHVVPVDLTKLSHGAALLFDGYKISKGGDVEIKVRDRTRAMENLVELLGFNRKKAIPHLDPDSMTDEELDAALEALQSRRLIGVEGSKPDVEGGLIIQDVKN